MGLNLEPVPENPAQKKLIAMIVAGVAVLALLLTVVTHRWLRAGGDIDAGMGLFGAKLCGDDGECKSYSNQEIIDEINRENPADQRSSLFPIMGYATCGLIGLSILALGGTIVLCATGKVLGFWPAPLALLLLIAALVAGCVFVGTNPTKGTAMQFGAGWSFFVFGIGVVVGIVGAQMLNKFKPADPAFTY